MQLNGTQINRDSGLPSLLKQQKKENFNKTTQKKDNFQDYFDKVFQVIPKTK